MIDEAQDYKGLLLQAAAGPGFGRGTFRRLAEALRVNTTFVSQVLRGPKHFSSDQALAAGSFFGLGKQELRYLLLLVQRDRAGTVEGRAYFEGEARALREQARTLASQVPPHHTVSAADKGEFYSSFSYSAVRLLTDIPSTQRPQDIANRLGLGRPEIQRILEFLTRVGLVRREGDRYVCGPAYTHLNPDSPLVRGHHRNWRLRAMEKHHRPDDEDLSFTAPLTVSREDAKKIGDLLRAVVDRSSRLVEKSPSEELYCLNLDFFRV